MMKIETTDAIYGDLFFAVQSGHVFADSKTFVDSIPKSDPAAILASYQRERQSEGFDLAAFLRPAITADLPQVRQHGGWPGYPRR